MSVRRPRAARLSVDAWSIHGVRATSALSQGCCSLVGSAAYLVSTIDLDLYILSLWFSGLRLHRHDHRSRHLHISGCGSLDYDYLVSIIDLDPIFVVVLWTTATTSSSLPLLLSSRLRRRLRVSLCQRSKHGECRLQVTTEHPGIYSLRSAWVEAV